MKESGWGKPRTAPALVATALPPLKPAKIGKAWPITAKRPKISRKSSQYAGKAAAASLVYLWKSMGKGIVPGRLLGYEKVLVVLPLPVFSAGGSLKKTFCPIHKPVGMEPSNMLVITTIVFIRFYYTMIWNLTKDYDKNILSELSVRCLQLGCLLQKSLETRLLSALRGILEKSCKIYQNL